MESKDELRGLVKQVRQHVETEQAFGAETWPARRARAAEVGEVAQAGAASEATERTTETPGMEEREPAGAQDRQGELDALRGELERCDRCQLCGTRSNLVFGVGNANAKIVFVGEAPGADEDRQGEPFVGRAGQLLTKIIEAMGLERKDVYIANILKCRPPENRTPRPEEVVKCLPYLRRQIAIIRPEVLVFLGNVAAQTLLETSEGITRLRGKFREYQGIRAMCTYHPAYLLRNPDGKKDVWEDMKKVMEAVGLKPAKRGRKQGGRVEG